MRQGISRRHPVLIVISLILLTTGIAIRPCFSLSPGQNLRFDSDKEIHFEAIGSDFPERIGYARDMVHQHFLEIKTPDQLLILWDQFYENGDAIFKTAVLEMFMDLFLQRGALYEKLIIYPLKLEKVLAQIKERIHKQMVPGIFSYYYNFFLQIAAIQTLEATAHWVSFDETVYSPDKKEVEKIFRAIEIFLQRDSRKATASKIQEALLISMIRLDMDVPGRARQKIRHRLMLILENPREHPSRQMDAIQCYVNAGYIPKEILFLLIELIEKMDLSPLVAGEACFALGESGSRLLKEFGQGEIMLVAQQMLMLLAAGVPTGPSYYEQTKRAEKQMAAGLVLLYSHAPGEFSFGTIKSYLDDFPSFSDELSPLSNFPMARQYLDETEQTNDILSLVLLDVFMRNDQIITSPETMSFLLSSRINPRIRKIILPAVFDRLLTLTYSEQPHLCLKAFHFLFDFFYDSYPEIVEERAFDLANDPSSLIRRTIQPYYQKLQLIKQNTCLNQI